jgi:dGTPase
LYPKLQKDKTNHRRLVHETIRRMINAQVVDLCQQSSQNIATAKPASIQDIRQLPMLIAFSASMANQQAQLKRFLRTNLYQHYRVNRMSAKAQRIITELFTIFIQDTGLLPIEYQHMAEQDQARAVADYIAGMTDRYAIKEYQRLFTIEERGL